MIRQHLICWDVDVLETDDIHFFAFLWFCDLCWDHLCYEKNEQERNGRQRAEE